MAIGGRFNENLWIGEDVDGAFGNRNHCGGEKANCFRSAGPGGLKVRSAEARRTTSSCKRNIVYNYVHLTRQKVTK